jgi:hypothetical protein
VEGKTDKDILLVSDASGNLTKMETIPGLNKGVFTGI